MLLARLVLGIAALAGAGMLLRSAARWLIRGFITVFAGAVAFAAAAILLLSVLVSFLRRRRRRARGTANL
jgi:hypothetical protein